MKISRTSLVALTAATMLAGAAATAHAASVFGPGSNTITFHNWENIFSGSTGLQVSSAIGAPAQAAVGDILAGILTVNSIYSDQLGSYSYLPTAGSNEITGVFAQKVTAIVGTTVYFAPLTAADYSAIGSKFTSSIDGTNFSLPSGWNFSGGEEFAFYQQTGSTDFTTSGTTMAASEATAVNGNLLFSLGYSVDANVTTFSGDTGYFYATVNNTTGTATDLTAHGGLQFLTNNTGSTFIAGAVDNTASAAAQAVSVPLWIRSSISDNTNVNSTALVAPWNFISSDPAKATTLVPVPAAAWTGLSMLGAMGGLAAMRRRKAAKA